MLIKGQVFTELLREVIGPYVEYNPSTGRPRLIQGLNDVWRAVDELGGISKVAAGFNVEEVYIHQWIDEHYIPTVFAKEIAEKLGYSDITELQSPPTGYEDAETGYSWPWSWKLCGTEMDAVALTKRSLRI